MSFKPPDAGTAAVFLANAFTPTVLNTGSSSTTSLTITRNSSSNTNAIVLQNTITGGRVGITWRDEDNNDLTRLQAHGADDPGSSTSQGVMYTRRSTPRLDGNMMEARQLWFAEQDFGQHAFFAGMLSVDTHDTDNNLWTDRTALVLRRSPSDAANEVVELLRDRTSGVGSNRFYRNLTSSDTAGPVVRIFQDNAGDDQAALSVLNDGTANGASGIVVGAANNSAIVVTQGYLELPILASHPANGAAGTVRIYGFVSGGKVAVYGRYPTGSAVQFTGAIEP